MDPTGLYTAAVLAGGKNTRFGGRDKAFAPVRGVPMIEMVINTLRGVFPGIIVVTNSPESYAGFSHIAITGDTFPGAGPLGGIHAAMKIAATPFLFVVSCDMPGIDRALIEQQALHFNSLDDADALVPRLNSGIEPLHAIYRTELAGKLESFLAATPDRSIRAFLALIRTVYYDLPPEKSILNSFRNINKPEDLETP